MIYKKKKILEVILLLIVIMGSIIASGLIIFDKSKPTHYNFLWILPFIYGSYFFIVWTQFDKFNYKVSSILILAIYGARMIFIPLVMYLGEYSTYGQVNVIAPNMNQALALMSWEFQVVIIFMLVNFGKESKKIRIKNFELNNKLKEIQTIKLPRRLKILITLVVFYLIIILIGTPGLLKESFFLTTGRSEESYELFFSGAVSHKAFGLSFGSQLVTIAFTFFWIIQALVPPYLLAVVCSKIKRTWVRNVAYLIILVCTVLISTEGRAHSIECALALMITTNIALKEKIKVNSNIIITIIVGVTIYGLMDKSSVSTLSNTARNDFSVMITAYFSGPQNVATAIAAASDNLSLGILNVFTDFLQRIPYITIIFTDLFGGTTNVVFNQYFGDRYLGQIIPSIGLGYVYFGFILAPIIPTIAVWFSMFFEKLAQKSPDIVSKNLYYLGVIMMARATATSNMLSGVTYLGNIFFAWVIIYFGFSKRNRTNLEVRKFDESNK